MTEEEKDLVLHDLCARLPYGVKVSVNGGEEPWTLKGMFEGEHTGTMLILEPSFPSKDVYPPTSNWPLSQCKPYLRPMSSMTEEEKEELRDTYAFLYSDYPFDDEDEDEDEVGGHYEPSIETYDFYNRKMFDYRGLISKGLALKAKDEMYKNV